MTDLVAFRMAPFTVGVAPRNERAYGLLVSDNYFKVLGSPGGGRFPQRDEMSRGAASRWSSCRTTSGRRGLAAEYAIGQSLRVNERELTVIGVTPEGFQGTVLGLQFDVWFPAARAARASGSPELDSRASVATSFGRLASGVVTRRGPGGVDGRDAELATRVSRATPL